MAGAAADDVKRRRRAGASDLGEATKAARPPSPPPAKVATPFKVAADEVVTSRTSSDVG